MSGKFVWFEYVSKDINKAQGFFGELFNWGVQKVPMPQGDYAMISAGERTIGGYMATPDGAPPNAHWLSHLAVANAKATCEQIVSLGGKIGKQPFAVGDHGTMAVAFDPLGSYLALWQPAKDAAQPAPTDNTFCWNELASDDPDKSVAFYQAIGGFSHKAQDMGPMGTYHVLESGGQPRAGIMKRAMPQQPTQWLPYVQVASADATSAKAAKLGGTIVVPPMDIPNVGRFSIFTDSQGAPLGILQAAK
jgi:predicted enzyme related to lactoylglutathione lyase